MRNYYCELVTAETIAKAMEKDEASLKKIVAHYKRYISKFATVSGYTQEGNGYSAIDPDIQASLESDLMLGIIRFKVKL